MLATVRIGFGVLVVVALVFQISVLVDEGVFSPTRFFLFFTVLSNLFAAAVLFEGGRRQLTGAQPVPDMVRGASVVYMTVTYLVFAVLLSDLQEQLQTNVVWVVQYEDQYRLCYVRGPEGIIIALAEQLS